MERAISRRAWLTGAVVAGIGAGVAVAVPRFTRLTPTPPTTRPPLELLSPSPTLSASSGTTQAPLVGVTSPSSTPTPTPTSTPSPSATPRPAATGHGASSATLAAYLTTRPGGAAVAALDLRTGRSLAYRSTSRFITASIVKVDILMTLLLAAQSAGRGLTSSQRSLAREMITESDNAAATALWNAIGGGTGLSRANRRFGLTDTTPGSGSYWGDTRTTARDQLRLLQVLTTTNGPLTAADQRYVLDLMAHVISGQRWGVSAAAGAGGSTALKNGWLATVTDSGLWTVNSIGRITRSDGSTLLMAVLTHGSPSQASGIATVEHAAALSASALA